MRDLAIEDEDGDALTWRWHDNVIRGLRFDIGDPENGDWQSDVVFDIDFILEWLCAPNGESSFRVAPATLAFHEVTDFAISVDQGGSAGRVSLVEWTIDRVVRERLDRLSDYWRWVIQLNDPPGGTIAFCASGYSEVLTGEPLVVSEQRLPRSERDRRGSHSETL